MLLCLIESHGSPASGNGSHHSESPVGSPAGSGSPAHSGSPPNSPGAGSGSPTSHHSGSPERSQSATPVGSPASHRYLMQYAWYRNTFLIDAKIMLNHERYSK